jgi:uncharacterized protein YndB with AHSA1/START domain
LYSSAPNCFSARGGRTQNARNADAHADGGHPVIEKKRGAMSIWRFVGRRHYRSAPLAADRSRRDAHIKEEVIMAENTVKLHRVLRAPAERVYRAFLDPDAMVKWLPPNGFTGKVHHIKAEVGGTYKMSFTNFTSGHSHSFGGEFLELVPNARIRHTDKFDDPNLPGQMQTTISLKSVSVGTELTVVQEGIPSAIPTEACYLGWQESLTLLAQLVEAEITEE